MYRLVESYGDNDHASCVESKQVKRASRSTRQKRAILACLAANRGAHLTAEGLCETLRETGTPVGLATVYRALKTLEKEGVVKKLFVADGTGACYRYVGDHPECNQHYHLVCDACGEVQHVESAELERFINLMSKQLEFAVDRRRMSFYGCCGMCAQKRRDGRDVGSA